MSVWRTSILKIGESDDGVPCLEKKAADCWHWSYACLVRARALDD